MRLQIWFQILCSAEETDSVKADDARTCSNIDFSYTLY